MNYSKKTNVMELDELYGNLLIVRSKLAVLKFLDAEMVQEKELIFGVKKNAFELQELIEKCLSLTETITSANDKLCSIQENK